MEDQIVNLVMQIGIIPALFIYHSVIMRKAIDNNTIVVTKLYERMGADKGE